jgi:hypothetical protein
MRPALFDPIARTDRDYPARSEAEWTYLNRSARLEAYRVRAAFREWFARWPLTEQAALAGRFRSKGVASHLGATFEIVLHEALLRLGLRVEPPPEVPGKTRHDFDVELAGTTLAVEATVVLAESQAERKQRRRMHQVLDALDELRDVRFRVTVIECRVTGSSPPIGRLRDDLRRLMDSVTDDDWAQWAGLVAARDFERIPKWTFDRGGTRIVLRLVPCPPGAFLDRGVIRLEPETTVAKITADADILAKFKDKGRKYSVAGRPYLLVINVAHWAGAQPIEVFNAVLGTERWPVIKDGGEPRLGPSFRDRNGAWGPRNTRDYDGVSALLIFEKLSNAWNINEARWALYENPWATVGLPATLGNLPGWYVDGENLVQRGGTGLGALLGLHPDWPMNG